MTAYPCPCNGNMRKTVGTVNHYTKGRKISIHNIPHYKCPLCNKEEYDITEVKVTSVLKIALEKSLSEIDYANYQKTRQKNKGIRNREGGR